MSSAQLEIQQPDEAGFDDAHAAPAPFALKQQAAERIAAHRARRQRNSPAPAAPIAIASPAKARAARIAAAVAERYAQSQSYRAFLAAEAEKAIHQAEAAADVAVLNAQAVAEAQYSLLAELDQLVPPSSQALTEAVADTPEPSTPAIQQTVTHTSRAQARNQPAAQSSGAGVTVRLLEDLTSHTHLSESFTNALLSPTADPLDDEGIALDDEIAFRQSPTFEPSTPPVEIPANLIEFPRQLVAARRARPRIAEGPLREDGEPQDSTAQLRIFEVEATQISTAPAPDSAATEWSTILLDAYPATSAQQAQYAADYAQDALAAQLSAEIPPQAATLNLRLMAAAVDACIILASFLAFTAVFAITAGKLPIGQFNLQPTVIAAGGVLALLAIIYQLLFFTFSDATPGMRYARIGLCTLTDENPSRSAMRRRIFALLLCACPLGIGVLWAWLDADRLGWHDRISRMYQRSY